MKANILFLALILSTSCNYFNKKETINSIVSKNVISKTYFVKGMTCGGCIFSVKNSLKNADDLNILDKDINVGMAILKFKKSEYKGKNTDCSLTKIIESKSNFTVFLDKDHQIPACIEKN